MAYESCKMGSIMIDNKTQLVASYGRALVKIIHAVNYLQFDLLE